MGAYLIYNDFTDGTPVTVTTGAQVIKTWTLDQTDAYQIRVQATFRLSTTGTSTVQAINPTVTIGTNVRTYAFTGSAIARDDYVTLIFAAESRAGDTVTAQLNASAGADANTTVNVRSFEIWMVGP